MTEQPTSNGTPVTYKLRVELLHQPVSTSFFNRFKNRHHLGQNIPINIALRITNIGETVFPGCNISDFKIKSTTEGIFTNSEGVFYIKPINPCEVTEINIDKITLTFKGTAWVSVALFPAVSGVFIQTYQFDCNHKKDNAYSSINAWGNSLFVQGEMEILQHKTNILLSALTILMVWESIFGLKTSIMKVLSIIGVLASWLGNVLGHVSR